MTRIAIWVGQAMEYLGGERDEPPVGLWFGVGSPVWGLWWGLLACLIFLFSGQSSKFIYIDF
jgi:hypothetical protein